MTPESHEPERLPETTDRDATLGISAGAREQPVAPEREEKRTAFGSIHEAYVRARDRRKRGQPDKQTRAAKSVDRSRGLLVLAVAVIIMIFVFLGMFSSSSGTKDRAANRMKPSLGRPEIAAAGASENRGSVTPLLNADMSGQEGTSDQVSADDVKATGRLRMRTQPKPEDTLASIPPLDPALDSRGVSPGKGWLPAACASGRKRSGSSTTGCAGP
jgi:hypothetical protein